LRATAWSSISNSRIPGSGCMDCFERQTQAERGTCAGLAISTSRTRCCSGRVTRSVATCAHSRSLWYAGAVLQAEPEPARRRAHDRPYLLRGRRVPMAACSHQLVWRSVLCYIIRSTTNRYYRGSVLVVKLKNVNLL
jgi:hypothetical protein